MAKTAFNERKTRLGGKLNYSVPIDFKLILMLSLMALLITLFISYYNRSIADVQLRASSFLYVLISIRDSRQSYFCNVAFTKGDIIRI